MNNEQLWREQLPERKLFFLNKKILPEAGWCEVKSEQ